MIIWYLWYLFLWCLLILRISSKRFIAYYIRCTWLSFCRITEPNRPESQALKLIGEIYAAEKPLKEVSVKERTTRRNTEARPKEDAFFSFVNGLDIGTPEMSVKLKDAVSYARKQEEFLRCFLEDGNILCDNGKESAI